MESEFADSATYCTNKARKIKPSTKRLSMYACSTSTNTGTPKKPGTPPKSRNTPQKPRTPPKKPGTPQKTRKSAKCKKISKLKMKK